MKLSDEKQILASLQDEWDGAYLYQVLAERESDAQLAEVYRRMAEAEKRHAATWENKLKEKGVHVPEYRPSWRIQELAWIARRFGPGAVLPNIMSPEQSDSKGYSQRSDALPMAADESSHARLLSN